MSGTTGFLSVGKIVGASLRIYRDRFFTYFKLAFKAYLWLVVPIFGWAKFAAISGQISRLVWSVISERPETVHEAFRHTDPRKWTFFLAGLLTGLILLVTLTLESIVLGAILALIGGAIFTFLGQTPAVLTFIVFSMIALIAFLFVYVWFFSRLSLIELPIALMDEVSAQSAIKESWQLTQGSVLRLEGVFTVAFLLTLPLSLVVNLVSNLGRIVLIVWFPQDSAIFIGLYLLFIFGLSLISGALIHPFWQALKAVIYYDLRRPHAG